MLHDMGIDTGIDLDALIEVAELAEELRRPEAARPACCAPAPAPALRPPVCTSRLPPTLAGRPTAAWSDALA